MGKQISFWKNIFFKKSNIAIGILVILSGVSFVIGQNFSESKVKGELVELGDGKKMRLEKPNGSSEGTVPDMMGRIKSIEGNKVIIEKYAMPQGSDNKNNHQAGESVRSKRMANSQGLNAAGRELKVEDEKNLILNEETVILKNSRSFQPGQGRQGNDSENKPENVSASDLKESDMVSVWLKKGESGNVVEKIMIRGM